MLSEASQVLQVSTRYRNAGVTVLGGVGAGIVGLLATGYMALATFSYALLLIGFLNRRHKKAHVWYMNLAIGLDLILVLVLELQREAVNTAMSFSLSPLQQAHIVTSSLATLLYVPILVLGWKSLLFGSTPQGRLWHMRLGKTALLFRTLGFILMFTLLDKAQV